MKDCSGYRIRIRKLPSRKRIFVEVNECALVLNRAKLDRLYRECVLKFGEIDEYEALKQEVGQ